MTNKRKLLVLLLITGMVNCIYGWENGNDLVKFWKEYKNESNEFFSRGLYMGYIAGCLDAIEFTNYVMEEAKYGRGNMGFSIPENATLGQICSIVGKWLDNNPEKWNLPGQMLVVLALQEAFPIEISQ